MTRFGVKLTINLQGTAKDIDGAFVSVVKTVFKRSLKIFLV